MPAALYRAFVVIAAAKLLVGAALWALSSPLIPLLRWSMSERLQPVQGWHVTVFKWADGPAGAVALPPYWQIALTIYLAGSMLLALAVYRRPTQRRLTIAVVLHLVVIALI
ncbi:MAG: hypothetical protein AAGC55_34355, partial [Myxococcota bacterium]